jgi:hypothetical protein
MGCHHHQECPTNSLIKLLPCEWSDFGKESFRKNEEKKFKMWKLFFGVQDPRKATPSKKTHPNWKIDPFLAWMQNVFRVAWNFGRHGSCDKQDVGFTDRHEDKQRVNYKDEGDGFLFDSIAEAGYTFCFFFCNRPTPSHYLRQDNLFMSAKLCAGAYNGENQVQIHGVVRKNGRGVPPCVMQEFQKNANKLEALSRLQFWKVDLNVLASFACLIMMQRMFILWVLQLLKSHGSKKKGKCTKWGTQEGENEVSSTKIDEWLQQWNEQGGSDRPVMKHLPFWSLDTYTKIVVVNFAFGEYNLC